MPSLKAGRIALFFGLYLNYLDTLLFSWKLFELKVLQNSSINGVYGFSEQNNPESVQS